MSLFDFYKNKKPQSSAPLIPQPIFSNPNNGSSTQSLDIELRGVYNDLLTNKTSYQQRHLYWNAYMQNTWTKLAVDIRAKAGSRKWKLSPTNASSDSPDTIDINDEKYAPVYKFLNEVNDRQNINQVLQEIQRDLIVFGCCFVEKKTTETLAKELVNPENLTPEIVGEIFENGIPYRVRVLQNETMDVQFDEYGNIFRYKQMSNGKEIFYSTDEIIHFTSGRNPIFGESEFISLTSIIAIDNLVNQRQASMLFNDTTLDALFSMPEGTSNDEIDASLSLNKT